MAAAAAAGAAGGGGSSVSSSVRSDPPLAVEALAAEWMLEFACSCLCRHFAEQIGAEFCRWRDVAQALIEGLSQIPPHQKKRVYLCQLLIRVAQGKKLVCCTFVQHLLLELWKGEAGQVRGQHEGILFIQKHLTALYTLYNKDRLLVMGCHPTKFENDRRISPLESALSFWTLLEMEENKLERLHEDIRRLIQIQIIAVHMEKRYFREAAEVLERLFTDSESDKPLRVKLAIVIKTKDPDAPLLQTFNYSLLISKIKSYTKVFMKENETNFLIQEATKYVMSRGFEATALLNRPVEVSESDESDLETKQRLVKEERCITSQSSGDIKRPTIGRRSGQKDSRALRGLNNMQNAETNEVSFACSRRRQRWTHIEDLELKSGVRKFGVGNWAKILAHGNFNNRTSVMLKDRWRTLTKMKQI